MSQNKGSFSLIGASRVGISLAYHFHRIGYSAEFVWNRSKQGLERSIKWVPFKNKSTSLTDFSNNSGWVIISVTDDAIEPVVKLLVKSIKFKQSTNTFHTSGFYSSSILNPLVSKGCKIGSFHPVLSVPDIPTGIEKMPSTVFTCEGKIQPALIELATNIGGRGIALTAEQKETIHIAAVFLSNYSVSMINAIKKLCKEKGLSENNAKTILKNLSEQAVENGWNKSLSEALTGPLARKDIKTIREHLDFLNGNKDLKFLYKTFGILTVKMLAQKDDLKSEILLDLFGDLYEI